jgi:hypothetical protein
MLRKHSVSETKPTANLVGRHLPKHIPFGAPSLGLSGSCPERYIADATGLQKVDPLGVLSFVVRGSRCKE